MKINTTKKVLAVVVATSMVFGSTIVAFADDNKASGTGIVEYDDSVAVEYDKVSVPTISDSTAFNFRLDPTGLLHEYEPSTYDGNSSVYFNATKVKDKIEAQGDATKLGWQDKDIVLQKDKTVLDPWAADGVWPKTVGGITLVQKTVDAAAKITFTSTGVSPLYVWSPDDSTQAKTGYSAGLPGQWIAITNDNINDWFEMVDETDENAGFKLKEDYRVETATKAPIDGRLYDLTIKEITGAAVEDSPLTPISKYVTIANGAITGYDDALFTSADGSNWDTPDAAKIKYTATKTGQVGYSDAISVVNKSTKDKKVTVAVTVKNATGLTFNQTNAYSTGTGQDQVFDDKASVYMEINDGSANPVVIGEDGKATYTATIAGKTGGAEITYRTKTANPKTGGYSYARYEGAGATYSANSFKIVATANTNTQAKDAWKEYGATITADTKPTIEVVYKVENVDDEEEEEVTPTAGKATVLQYQGATWLALQGTNGALLPDSITSVVVNTKDVTAKAQFISGVIGVKATDLVAAGVTVQGGTPLEATYVVDGVTYTASYTP